MTATIQWMIGPARRPAILAVALIALFPMIVSLDRAKAEDPASGRSPMLGFDVSRFDVGTIEESVHSDSEPGESDARSGSSDSSSARTMSRGEMSRVAQTVALFALVSLAPVAVLMATAFVRINVVLLLLRQALGSPQVPGNQVIAALALLLTALVMAPTAETVYRDAIRPYADGELSAEEAWNVGASPIKAFMIDQTIRVGHERYLVELYAYTRPESRAVPWPSDHRELPLRVVAPAFLVSELTTALWIGFLLYLPFLLIDLVVSAVLAATGLIMLPPAQVALPLKLALFVLADGWWLVADALLRTFALGSAVSG